jgi:mannose-6-phosphate isomerase-like protein (cupin superfamily)
MCVLSMKTIAQQAPTPKTSMPQASATSDEVAKGGTTLLSTSETEIEQRIAKAEEAAKAGTKGAGVSTLVSWGPYQGNMAYRNGPYNMYFANEDSAELFVVLDGGGTLELGGTLVNPTRIGARLQARTITGGTTYKLSKGDMFMVPPSLVHSITQVDGKLVYLTMHLPVPAVSLPSSGPAPGR